MNTEKNNLLIIHEIDNADVFISDIVSFTDKITNNGLIDKQNITIQDIITDNYRFIDESLMVNGISNEGNIIDGIKLSNISVGATIVITYKAKAIKKNVNINTYTNIKCCYLENSSLQYLSKNSDIIESNVYEKRLSILLSAEKQLCKLNDINNFTISLFNYDKNQAYYNGIIKATLSDNYEFVRNSLSIDGVTYNGTNDNILIEAIKSNTNTIIKFQAKAISVGSSTLSGNVSFYYKDTTSNELESSVEAQNILTNIYENSNDNVTIKLEMSPLITPADNASSFRISIVNDGSEKLKNVLVKLPFEPNYKMVANSIKINGISAAGDINTGITLDSVDTGITTISFLGLAVNIVSDILINAVVNYTYVNDLKDIETKRVSNNVYYTITEIRDQLLLWNISTLKDEYFVGEKIDFTISAINTSDVPINLIDLYTIIPDEIDVIRGTTKLDGEVIDDISKVLIIEKLWGVNEERKITFSGIVNSSSLENTKTYASMVYSSLNSDNVSISKITQSNELLLTLINHENVQVGANLSSLEGYLIKLNDTVHFTLNIYNNNDYKVNLTNVTFLMTLNSTYLTLNEADVLQDGKVISKDETNNYRLNDIEANGKSSITFNAKGIKASTLEQIVGANLNYVYKDPQGYDVEKSIYDEVTLNIIDSNVNDISVLKEVNLKNCNVTDELHYEVTITNNGTLDLNYLFIKDTFDEYVNFIEGSLVVDGVSKTDSIEDGIVLKSLKQGESTLVRFKGQAIKKGTNNNVAYVVLKKTDEATLGIESNATETVINEVINPSLKIVKFNNKTNYYVDDENHFEVTVSNTENVRLNNVKLNEILNEHLNYLSGTLKLDGYKFDDVLTDISIGSINPNESKRVNFGTLCLSEATDIVNKIDGVATYLNDENEEVNITATSNERTFNILVSPINLELAITMEKKVIEVGNTANYIVKIKNTNDLSIAIRNINFGKILKDEYYSFNADSVKQDGIKVTGNEIDGYTINDIAANATSVVSFSAKAIKLGNNISNEAVITYSFVDAENITHPAKKTSTCESFNVLNTTDEFELTKEISKSQILLGSTVHFTINYKNKYQNKQSSIVINDEMSDGFQYVLGTTTLDGVKTSDITVGITLDNVNYDEEHKIEFDAKAIKVGRSTNKAYGLQTPSGEIDKYGKYSNTVSAFVQEEALYDFWLKKESDKEVYVVNDIAHFTITAYNAGNSQLDDLVFSDTLDAKYTFVEGSILINGEPYVGNLSSIKYGNWYSDKIVIEFDATAITAGSRIANDGKCTFSYVEDGKTINLNRFTNTLYTNIVNDDSVVASLTLKTDKVVSVVGDTVTFISTITNSSEYNKPMNNINFSKMLKTNYYTFDVGSVKQDGVTVPGDETNGYTLNDIGAGKTSIVTFTATAKTQILVRQSPVSSTITYSYLGKDETEQTATLTATYEPYITKQSGDDYIVFDKYVDKSKCVLGDNVHYTIVMTNIADFDITLYLIRDEIPDKMQYVNGSTLLNGEVTTSEIIGTYGVMVPGLASKETTTVEFDVTAIKAGLVTNTGFVVAQCKANGDAGFTASKLSQIDTEIYDTVMPKSTIVKSISNNDLRVGETYTITIDVTNTGNVNIENAIISDILDSHFSYKAGTLKVDGVLYDEIPSYINLDSLIIDKEKKITFDVLCDKAGTDILNKATLLGEYVKDDETGEVSATSNELKMNIRTPIEASMIINKFSNKMTYVQGDIATFTIKVQNTGNIMLSNIALTDNLDNHYEFVKDSIMINDKPYAGDLATAILVGNLDENGSSTIVFKGIAKNVGTGITNKVSILATYLDNNKEKEFTMDSNEIITDIMELIEGKLEIVETADDTEYIIDSVALFTTTVKNIGNASIDNAIYTGDLNSNLEFIPDSIMINDIPYTGNLESISLGQIDINETDTIKYKAKCIHSCNDALNSGDVKANYIDALGAEQAINQESNEASIDIYNANFTASKSVSSEYLKLNGVYTFKILLKNIGDLTINNLSIIDDLEAEFEFVTGSIKIDGVKYDHDLMDTISVPILTKEKDVTVTFDVKCIKLGDTSNEAEVVATFKDKMNQDKEIIKRSNLLDVTIKEDLEPKASIVKIVTSNNVKINKEVSVEIDVVNTGNVKLENLIVEDILSEYFKYVENSITIDNILYDGGPDSIKVGEIDKLGKKVIKFKIIGIKTGTNIENIASLVANYQEDDEVKEYKDTSNVVYLNIYNTQELKMAFTKEVEKNNVKVGDELNFIINTCNLSNISLDEIIIKDNLDDLFEYVQDSTKVDGVITGNIITGVKIDSIKVNDIHRIDFKVKAKKAYNDLKNTALMAVYYTDEFNEAKAKSYVSNEVAINVFDDYTFNGTLVKATLKDEYFYNEVIPVTLKLTNNGTIDYDEIIIKDELNKVLNYVDGSLMVDGKKYSGDIITGVKLDGLKVGNEINITFDVTSNKKNIKVNNVATASISYINNGKKDVTINSNNVAIIIKDNYVADLEIEKSSSYTDLLPGESTYIVLRLTNTGTCKLTGIKLFDNIASDFTIMKDTLTIDGIKSTNDIKKGVVIPDMDINHVTIVKFEILAMKGNFDIRNRAYATYSYQELDEVGKHATSYSNELDLKISTEVNPNIKLIKVSDSISYVKGSTAIFKLVTQNKGNVDILNINVIDELPAEYSFVLDSLKINGIISQGDITKGIKIDVLEKQEENIIEFKAVANTSKHDIINNYKVSFEYESNGKLIQDNITSDNYLTSIYDSEDGILEIVKSVDLTSVSVNDYLLYTIYLKNVGTKKLSNIKVIDLISDKFELVDDSVMVDNEEAVDDINEGLRVDSLGVGEEKNINFKVKAIVAGNIVNNANATYSYMKDGKLISDNIKTNDVSVEVTNKEASLVIKKIANFKDTYLNEFNRFVISVKNTGKETAYNVNLIDKLDVAYEYVKDSLKINNGVSQGDLTTGLVIDEIIPEQVVNISYEVIGGKLQNDVENILSATYMGNNNVKKVAYSNDCLTNIVERKYAKILITKEFMNTTIKKNDENEVKLIVTNIGNVDANDVLVNDIIDSAYSEVFNSITINGTKVVGSIINGINVGTIESQQKKTINFKLLGIASKIGILNTANVTYNYLNYRGTIEDETVSSNEVSSNILEDEQAIIEIYKESATNNLKVDEENSFILKISNKGNKVTSKLVVRDILPSNYLVIDGSVMVDGKSVRGDISNGIELDNLEPNKSIEVKFKAKAVELGLDIINEAYVDYKYLDNSSKEIARRSRSNKVKTNIVENKIAYLSITKKISPNKSIVNDTLTFDIVIKNTGELTARSIILSDILPVNLKYVLNTIRVNGNLDTNNDLSNVIINDLGQDMICEISFKCQAIIPGSDIINIVHVDYDYEFDNINHHSQAISNLVHFSIYDEEIPELIVKQTVGSTNLNKYDTNLFTFNFINNSSSSLTNVILRNYLTEEYLYNKNVLKLQSRSSVSNSINPIVVGEIGANSTKILAIDATAVLANSNIVNEGMVTFDYKDSLGSRKTSGVNTESVITNILEDGSPNIIITRNMASIAEVGKPIQVSITIENTGNKKATNILIKEVLGAEFELVDGTLIVDGKMVQDNILNGINIDTIEPNKMITLSYEIMPINAGETAKTNSDITYKYEDINGISREKKVNVESITDVIPQVVTNVTVVKDSDSKNYYVGDIARFRIVITNNEEVDLSDLTVKDIMDDAYKFVEGSIKIDGTSYVGNLLEIKMKKIKARSVVVITYDAESLKIKNNIINIANLNYSLIHGDTEIDENINSNSYVSNIVDEIMPNVLINKRSAINKVVIGSINSFIINIQNKGLIKVDNVNLTDVLDSKYEFVQGSVEINNKLVNDTLDNIDLGSIDINQMVVIKYKALAKEAGKNIENSGILNYQYEDIFKKVYDITEKSNINKTDIINKPTEEVINLLKNIFNEENGIGDMVDVENKKLESVIKSGNTDEILNINSSITEMIKILTTKERIAYQKLLAILNDL